MTIFASLIIRNIAVKCSFLFLDCYLAGVDAVPLSRLTVDQVASLLRTLGLGEYSAPSKARGITGGILVNCTTKERLAAERVNMTPARFGLLRSALDHYTSSGVPKTMVIC